MTDRLTGYRRLVVWEKADELVREIYLTTRNFPKEEQFGLTSQLRRAALSVPLNIVEGYARWSDKSFANFLTIAYGSLMEVEYLLSLSSDLGYLEQKNADKLISLTKDVAGLLWRLRRKVVSRS